MEAALVATALAALSAKTADYAGQRFAQATSNKSPSSQPVQRHGRDSSVLKALSQAI